MAEPAPLVAGLDAAWEELRHSGTRAAAVRRRRPRSWRLRNAVLPVVRVLAGVDVLAMSVLLLSGFGAASHALVRYGFPMPWLFLGLTLAAGLFGGMALVVGFRARLAAFALMLLFLPQALIFDALYTGNAWGAWQGVLQVLRVLQAPILAIIFFWLLLDGAGPISLDARQAAREAADDAA